jgi:hypothetical protein
VTESHLLHIQVPSLLHANTLSHRVQTPIRTRLILARAVFNTITNYHVLYGPTFRTYLETAQRNNEFRVTSPQNAATRNTDLLEHVS